MNALQILNMFERIGAIPRRSTVGDENENTAVQGEINSILANTVPVGASFQTVFRFESRDAPSGASVPIRRGVG